MCLSLTHHEDRSEFKQWSDKLTTNGNNRVDYCGHVLEQTRGGRVTKLISFDIDGTLEVGDPPGGITMEMVRHAKGLGYLIGSCSDRTVSEQRRIWRDHGIKVEFTVLKHRLEEVKERFPADEYYHVGDTEADRRASLQAGFIFLSVGDAVVRLRNGLTPP